MDSRDDILLECSSCGKEKPLSEYYSRPEFKRGYTYSCRVCIQAKERASRAVRKAKKKNQPAEPQESSTTLSLSAVPWTAAGLSRVGSTVILHKPDRKERQFDFFPGSKASVKKQVIGRRSSNHRLLKPAREQQPSEVMPECSEEQQLSFFQ